MPGIEERESVILTNKGQKIFGILHLPKQQPKAPCVLICHGLGGNKVGHFRVYVDLSERLVELGIASLRFDFRGSGDSEGKFADMTLKGEVSDGLAALSYLASHPRIDPKRIGIFGRSMGGAIAVLVGAAAHSYVASMALWAPMFNGEQWQEQWKMVSSGAASNVESEDWRRINGQVASLTFYAEMFDMGISEKLKTLNSIPLLLIHGDRDEIMAFSHSQKYVEARRNASGATILTPLANADHDFSNQQARELAVDQTVSWFKNTL